MAGTSRPASRRISSSLKIGGDGVADRDVSAGLLLAQGLDLAKGRGLLVIAGGLM